MDLEQLEALAFSDDRAAALAGLLPGTALHAYWRGLHLQHQGKLDEVDALLAEWGGRPGQEADLRARLERRQLLLRAGQDLAAHADALRVAAGRTLDDQAEVETAAQRYPTRLDPELVAQATLVEQALGRAPDLRHLTEQALPELVTRDLEPDRRRDLLRRLPRANLPGLTELVVRELSDPRSPGFGSLAVLRLLTIQQLVDLGTALPALCQDATWVAAVLVRLRPAAHVDWQDDLDARGAYLDALWKFVESLAPSFNGIKVLVLHHRLDLDRRQGRYERARFLRYLELPRRAGYVPPEWLGRFPSTEVASLDSRAHEASTGLPPVVDDRPLVEDYLARFLVTEEVEAFAERIERGFLLKQLATTRLLAGDPDTARWTAALPEEEVVALRDRVDLDLSPRNPARIGAADPVSLEVSVKNVPELTVKVFRVDALAYFMARGTEVDTGLDLDGMVAGDERTLRFDAPPIQRVTRRIELPGCDAPGTYVVELIGNGTSSRALIQKGGLRHTVRIGAAGPTLRVYDEEGRPLPGARVWMGGREHTAREDGEISLPFSTTPGRAAALLLHGDVARAVTVDLVAETYRLAAGFYLERESLAPGKTARVLLRPSLGVAGWPAPLALVEEPRVEIRVTDLAGTTSTRVEPVELHDDAETAVAVRVPEDAVKIGARLLGRVRVASTQQTIDLSDDTSGEHNLVRRVTSTELLHLATTEAGHVLHLLGLTGEPRAGRAVVITFAHQAISYEVQVTLATDDRGRIELGQLPGIERIRTTVPNGAPQVFPLATATAPPAVFHAVEGTSITLPAPPGIPEGALAAALSLVELRSGMPARDLTDRVQLDRRALEISGLVAGSYRLSARGFPVDVTIRVAPSSPSADAGDWAPAGPTMLELSPPLPLVRGLAVEGGDLVVRLSGAGPATRVHLVATRFRPDPVLARTLARAPRLPAVAETPAVPSRYVSGRDIGDEHRYVLERRRTARRPGMLLDKPSLLLDPWARAVTTTTVQTAAPSGMYAAAMPAPRPAAQAPQRPPSSGATVLEGLTSVDFLAAPAVVIDDLRPDADGVVRVPRERLGEAQLVQALVIDPALGSVAELALPETAPAPRALGLRLALDPERHFTEERRVEGAPRGTRIVVDDVRSGKLEVVDTVARAHTLLLSLGGDETLREFSFVTRWQALDAAARRSTYSKYACHELNLFLHQKDPAFFAEVVRPHLAGKRHRTFVDRWLLGEDLEGYLEPWAFGRLNTLERVLLARRVPAVREAVARLVGDAVDLIPPDPTRDSALVDALLGAAALEEGGLAGAAASVDYLASDLGEAEASADGAYRLAGDATASPPPFGGPQGDVLASAGPPEKAKSAGRGGGGAATRNVADLRQRGGMDPQFRAADRTQEWAESGYWHRRADESGPDLVGPNRFFRDLALHREGPFLSPYLGECAGSLPAALACLAFLDLPFVAGAHEITVEDARLTFVAGSDALAARTRIVEIAPTEGHGAILVGQSTVRADDRWIWEGDERREKYVTGELLTGVIYQCQVVVSNPTSASRRLELLLQIPGGAIPVSNGFYTRTMHLRLDAYATSALEYAYYFPAPGTFSHFPAHVTSAGALLASAEPETLTVVGQPTSVDARSWAHLSQHGTTDEVLAFLARENLGRVDLDRIAWRMRDRDAFTRVTALLDARKTYADHLWAYGLAHADRRRVAEWLRHQDDLVRPAGPVLEGGLADLDPLARGTYEHLEYAPLVNARAHQLGRRRRILNDGLDRQYRAFLEVVAHRACPTDDDRLSAAHYLFCLDRIEDALAAFSRVDPGSVRARMQYDYLAAYAASCRGDLGAARRFAAPWRDHQVDRWRFRFAALWAMLDEAGGRAPAEGFQGADPDDRDRKMDELAARQPSLSLVVEGGVLLVQHGNLSACEVRFHRLDLELCFSRQPFLQGDVERFSWIAPGQVLDLPLGEGERTPIPIPDALARQNLVVEARARGLRASVAHYAHDLSVQVARAYGQLRVLRASTGAPLPATYVKVYGRQKDGAVAFYKDGYTDLRGRFDYATLSTDDLDRIDRFALLVTSDEAGATVLEAQPPPR